MYGYEYMNVGIYVIQLSIANYLIYSTVTEWINYKINATIQIIYITHNIIGTIK